MDYVTSRDETKIAYERSGSGPPVVLIASALADRGDAKLLARHLSQHFTVLNYDRRGRGSSGDTAPYQVAREVEDIDALIEAAGGSASAFGSSSGAVLALDAANALGEKVTRLALFEPPFIVDDTRPPITADDVRPVEESTSAGRRDEAVKDFLTRHLGMPTAHDHGDAAAPNMVEVEEARAHLAVRPRADEGHPVGRAAPQPLALGVRGDAGAGRRKERYVPAERGPGARRCTTDRDVHRRPGSQPRRRRRGAEAARRGNSRVPPGRRLTPRSARRC